MMKDPGLVGIGCFAKPEMLSRVLKKMVEGYILGNFKGLTEENNHNSTSSELIQLLKAIIVHATENQQTMGAELIDSLEGKKITGFFLALKNEHLNLSLFTRENRLKCKKFSTNLDALTQIRKKRLN